MIKNYLLLFLLFAGLSASATTVTIYPGSTTYQSGNVTSTGVRTSGNIRVTGAATSYRGYAVFDLSSIPAGAQITSCVVGFYVSTYGATGTASGWNMYGYAGDLSLVTTAATLYSDCIAGTSLATTTFGAATGNHTMPTTAAADTFVAHNIGSTVSITFYESGNKNYVFSPYNGAGGHSTTATAHAPYIQITYCVAPTGVSATAAPSPVCAGSTLNLTGAATGATSYAWSGPGGFTSTSLSPTLTAAAANAGIYTLTATNTCAGNDYVTTATTAAVTVNTPPAAITGPSTVCVGSTITLNETVGGGTWSSTPPSVAGVAPNGVVTGSGSGSATVSYTVPGCTAATASITVNSVPTSVSASATPATLCAGETVNLTGSATGATGYSWNGPGSYSAGSATASFTAASSNAGTYTLTATNGCGSTTATTNVTVYNTPQPISGSTSICTGTPSTLSDIVLGGTWSSTNPGVATVTSGGVVSGLSTGTSTISYVLSGGCSTAIDVSVIVHPGPITGITNICPGGVLVAGDSASGGTWHSTNTSVATISSGTGVVAALTTGSTIISYSNSCATVTASLTVSPLPEAITGSPSVCTTRSISLSDGTSGGTWHSADYTIATVDINSGEVTGVTGGSVLITYTTGPACIVSMPVTVIPSVPVTVTMSANPGFSSCQGVAVAYAATPVNGGTAPHYVWLVNGTTADTGNVFTYTPANTDNITVKLASSALCPSADTVSTSNVLTVNPSVTPTAVISTPAIHDSVSYLGEMVTFFATLTYGGTSPQLQWYSNGVAVSGATSNTYSPHVYSDATVYCRMISETPCAVPDTVISNPIKITATFLGVNNLSAGNNTLNVYPNPSQGIFTLHSDKAIADGNVEITDISGRSVYHMTLNEPAGGFDQQINPEIPQGVYLLKVSGTGFQQTFKLVIDK